MTDRSEKRPNQTERVACPMCFTGDTMVSVDNNLIPISRLNGRVDGIGNDARKKSQKIIQIFERDCTGNLLELKVRFLPPIFITPEHPVMVRHLCKPFKRSTSHRMCGIPLIWKKAKDLGKGDFVVIPREYCRKRKQRLNFRPYLKKFTSRVPSAIRNNHTILDETWAELMGWYVSEGHCTAKELVFSLNKNEIKNIARIRELARKIGYSTYVSYNTATQIHLTSRILPRAFAVWFGKGARNKRIPDFIMKASHKIRMAFLRSYLLGDGCYDNKRARQIVSSASKQLMRQIQLLTMQEGICFSYRESQRGGLIGGRMLAKTTKYSLEATNNPRYVIMSRRFIYLPIRWSKPVSYEGKLYNLQTEDGTYQVPFVVHNCGWWRTVNFGVSQRTGELREVRFDKVDLETAPMWRLERLVGAGRGSKDAKIELVDSHKLGGLSPELKSQIRQQCRKILEILEEGAK